MLDRLPAAAACMPGPWASDLNIAGSNSRPHVPDDHPYSESPLKTMPYRLSFPARFGSIEDARSHCQTFVAWSNTEHRHSGTGYMTPGSVHYGHAQALRDVRQAVPTPRSWSGSRLAQGVFGT